MLVRRTEIHMACSVVIVSQEGRKIGCGEMSFYVALKGFPQMGMHYINYKSSITDRSKRLNYSYYGT